MLCDGLFVMGRVRVRVIRVNPNPNPKPPRPPHHACPIPFLLSCFHTMPKGSRKRKSCALAAHTLGRTSHPCHQVGWPWPCNELPTRPPILPSFPSLPSQPLAHPPTHLHPPQAHRSPSLAQSLPTHERATPEPGPRPPKHLCLPPQPQEQKDRENPGVPHRR